MKKILIILFICITSIIQAATYYVAPDGQGSNGNSGTAGSPWADVAYALTQVSSGDSIYFQVGTHTIATQTDIPVQVSLIGAGNTSIINSTVTGEWAFTFMYYSASEGTNGNQVIANLRFNGNTTGNGVGGTYGAVMIRARSNVEVHDCEFYNFQNMGVTFSGKVPLYNPGTQPVTRATGNKFYNNYMNNCAGFLYANYGDGALQYGSQQGIEIYGNTIIGLSRDPGYNGYCIKYFNGGFSQAEKIHNNVLRKEAANDITNTWNFAIELWGWCGGTEIYNNDIYGGIDVGGAPTQGGYPFLADIHHNNFGYDTLQTNSLSTHNAALYIENTVPYEIRFHNNYVRNVFVPIQWTILSQGAVMSNHHFYYNIFENIGTASATPDALPSICNWTTLYPAEVITSDNISFINNVFYAGNGGAGYGILLPDYATATNYTIRNNIFQGFSQYPILSNLNGSESLDTLSIENNVFYNNGNNSIAHDGFAPTNNTTQNNLVVNPLFEVPGTDYRLQSSSTLIDAGLNNPYTYDYDSNFVPNGALPDIGAYEYYSPDSSLNHIISLTFANQSGSSVIDTNTHTVTAVLSYGYSLTAVAPSIIVSQGAGLTPQSGTVRNFNTPQQYTVTALDGTPQIWTVTITSAAAPEFDDVFWLYNGSYFWYNGSFGVQQNQ